MVYTHSSTSLYWYMIGQTININNYRTSIAPISSKRIELSGAPSTGVGQTHSGKFNNNDQMEGKLRKDKRVWKGEFSNDDGKKASGSEFQRVGTATENARGPACVLTLRIDNKWKPDEYSPLSLGANSQNEYCETKHKVSFIQAG